MITLKKYNKYIEDNKDIFDDKYVNCIEGFKRVRDKSYILRRKYKEYTLYFYCYNFEDLMVMGNEYKNKLKVIFKNYRLFKGVVNKRAILFLENKEGLLYLGTCFCSTYGIYESQTEGVSTMSYVDPKIKEGMEYSSICNILITLATKYCLEEWGSIWQQMGIAANPNIAGLKCYIKSKLYYGMYPIIYRNHRELKIEDFVGNIGEKLNYKDIVEDEGIKRIVFLTKDLVKIIEKEKKEFKKDKFLKYFTEDIGEINLVKGKYNLEYDLKDLKINGEWKGSELDFYNITKGEMEIFKKFLKGVNFFFYEDELYLDDFVKIQCERHDMSKSDVLEILAGKNRKNIFKNNPIKYLYIRPHVLSSFSPSIFKLKLIQMMIDKNII